MNFFRCTAFLFLLTFLSQPGFSQSSAAEKRAQAEQLQKDGNFKEALTVFLELLKSKDAGDPEMVLEDLRDAVTCSTRLNTNEFDVATLREILNTHPENWRLIPTAAGHAAVIANRYRDPEEENPTNRYEWWRWYEKAMPLAEKAGPNDKLEAGRFWHAFSDLVGNRDVQPWELHQLTDVENPPETVDQPRRRFWGNAIPPAAAVDANGDPLYHEIPESYAAAKSDGERWRFLREKAAVADPGKRAAIEFGYAEFLEGQFSVITTGERFDPDKATRVPLFAWHLLADEESVARLATGISGVRLPEGHRFIEIYENIIEQLDDKNYTQRSREKLATIYENRGQYPKAAAIWKTLANATENDRAKKRYTERHHQIVDNLIGFDQGKMQPAGSAASVSLTYRNTPSISFSAQRIDLTKLIADTKKYLKSDPDKLETAEFDMNGLGRRMLKKGNAYFSRGPDSLTEWKADLEPLPNHWDTKTELVTPLSKPGAYWVTAKAADGNTAHQIVWIADTMIVGRDIDGGEWYFVADSKTGDPIPNARVEVFGYHTENKEKTGIVNGKKKRYWITKVGTRESSKKTGDNGDVIFEAGIFNEKNKYYQRLITATTDDGRIALSGFENFWGWRGRSNYRDVSAAPVKAFIMSDRPAYRPGQTVKFKAWVREAKYGGREWSKFSGDKFQVIINDGRNEKVFEEKLKADAFGGISGEFALLEDATLGQYSVWILESDDTYLGTGTFRVEEYKKPEFEVKVEAPDEAIALGEKFKAKVSANYYFGAPVTSATVKYTVKRHEQDTRWFPHRPWDWLYGRGYGWFATDAEWYPGWNRWGCVGPIWPWYGYQKPEPELVASGEVEIGQDGTAEIEIDTAMAKALHSDTDHRYEISIEVTDESRRVIEGSGSVTAARNPFEVFAWTDRGFYKNGQEVTARFRAQNADGKAITGKGVITLYSIDYDIAGKPIETKVESWDIDPDEAGNATKTFPAGASGQYRIEWKVTSAKGHTGVGAALFTVRGEVNDPADFRYSALELTTDATEYAPGDVAEILVASDNKNAAVMLFLRPVEGVSLKPIFARLPEKSDIMPVKITEKDQPNFFVDALTVHEGKVHSVTREIVVPPEKRILNVSVAPAKERTKPGEKTDVTIRLTDRDGQPFEGTAVVSIYDKSIEYISGGSNVPEIKKYFWGWKRHHNPMTWSTFNRVLANQWQGDNDMAVIGFAGNGNVLRTGFGTFGRSGGIAAPMAMSKSAVPSRAPAAPMSALAADSIDGLVATAAGGFDATAEAAQMPNAPVTVRTKFADTAIWSDSIITDTNGEATVSLDMPENLSTWKIKTWAMGHGTVVGEGEAEIITSKNLLIRQQSPRFFIERDEVTLSANVHNYLDEAQSVEVSLEFGGSEMALAGGESTTRKIQLEPNGEQRVDWKVEVAQEGEAIIRMKALAAGESDAVEMSYPVLVHGALVMEAWSQIVKPDAASTTLSITVPQDRRPEQTRLEIRYSPSIAAAMVDALPYLADFPYGCTEQTLNRFLPSAITQNILNDLDIGLADIRKKTANLNAGELGDAKERGQQWDKYRDNPVFSEARLNRMVKKGVNRLQSMQNPDGGWGWFSGGDFKSYPHTTAWTVRGLLIAADNGVNIDKGALGQGILWLANYQQRELARFDLPDDDRKKKKAADAMDALVACVISQGGENQPAMLNRIFEDRINLPVYAKSLAGMAFHNTGQRERVDMILQNIEQHLTRDAENQTAWLELKNRGYWWYWYGSETEAHAFYLKLLAAARPDSEIASELVKWLLNNRKNGTHWSSTRDTALCIEAIGDYLKVSGETGTTKTVIVSLDGEEKKRVTIDPKSLFDFDDRLVIEGEALAAGDHKIEVRREGEGPVYVSTYLTNFTKEDNIKAAGLDVKVERRFFKLTPKKDAEGLAQTDTGGATKQKVEAFERTEIKDGDAVEGGDLIEVELKVTTKNDAEYLVIEDPKAAGFEPVEFNSGYHYGGRDEVSTYREFRDEKVAHFVRWLPQGKHFIRYRTRAEIPGKFHALPARAEAMYAPELVGSSDKQTLLIR